MITDPRGRWRQQYQRVADVLTQRAAVLDEAEAVDRYGSLKMRDYVKALVDTAPPLTPEQRDRLAALLRPMGETR
jgi:hypothetical protein